MRAIFLPCLLCLAACAGTPKDLNTMPIAEVCYLGMVEPDKQQAVSDEVRRRNEDCNRHSAEIAKIRDIEARSGMSSGTSPQDAAAAQRSGGGMGGGMGRGY